MSQTIYKLVLGSYNDAYYRLSDEERQKLSEKCVEGIRKTGAKWISVYNCRWSNDEYQFFGLMEYPDAQAVIDEIANAEEAGLFRYLESKCILGIEIPMDSLDLE